MSETYEAARIIAAAIERAAETIAIAIDRAAQATKQASQRQVS